MQNIIIFDSAIMWIIYPNHLSQSYDAGSDVMQKIQKNNLHVWNEMPVILQQGISYIPTPKRR